MVIVVALMLAVSIALAVGAIHCNHTIAQGHWAKQDIGAVLFNFFCGFATRTTDTVEDIAADAGDTTPTPDTGTDGSAATLVATSGKNWSAKDMARGRWLVRNERTCRPATGSHRVVMARWERRRRFKPVAKVEVQADLRMWVSAGPNRAVRRLKAGVRARFLSRLAEKRAEEKEELEAVEAALAAEAARAEGRALARAAAKAETRAAWLAARAARRAQAGRTGKLGAVTEEMKFSVRKYRNESVVVKTNPQQAANGKLVQRPFKARRKQRVTEYQPARSWYSWALENARNNPEVALQLDAELQRCARLERAYGVIGLMADEAVLFQNRTARAARSERQVKQAKKAARLAAHQAREAARAAEREAKDWVRWQRDAVKMGLASPVVTKRPGMSQGMVAHATILPVLAEYLGFGLGVAIIGILAAVAIPAFLKFITKSKTNEAGLNPLDASDDQPADTDADDDSIADADDNCPTVLNPGQENSDDDAQGDACDNDDDDGLTDEEEAHLGTEPTTGLAAGGVSYATMHDWDEYYADLRKQIEWAQAQLSSSEIDFYEGYEPSEEDLLRWEKEEQVQKMQEAAYLAFCKGQSSLALILPVLGSLMDLGLWFVVAAVVIGLSDEVKADLKKVIASRNLAQIKKAVFEISEVEERFSREPLATDFIKDLISRGPDGAVTYINRFVCTRQEAKARAEAQAAEELAAQAQVQTEVTQEAEEAPASEQATQIQVPDEVKAIIGKISDLARNRPVYPNDGPEVGPRPCPPSSRENENWEADSRAYNEAYTAWLAQESAAQEHYRNWLYESNKAHLGQIEDLILTIPEIKLLDVRDVVLMCRSIDSNCNLDEKLNAFTNWVIESVAQGAKVLSAHQEKWQEYVRLCNEAGEKPDTRKQEYKLLYGHSYTTTVALGEMIEALRAEVLRKESEKAAEAAKAEEAVESVTPMVPETAKPEKAASSAKADLKTANLSGLFGGAIRSNKANAFALPILAPVMGLDVDPLLFVAMVAMTWLISKVSPSFGGFALTLLAGAFGYAAATVTGQEADSLPEEGQQGNQPHTDQEGLMVEESAETANDRALELFKALKPENVEAIRCSQEDYKSLVLPAAMAMIRVLLGKKVELNLTSPDLFNWPGFDEKDAKVAYKVHVDSMAPYAQKTAEIMAAFEKFYGFKPFNVKPGDVNVWQKSLHHLHRAPSSGASIDFYFTVKRALDCLKKHGDLRHLTAGELAQAWATLNLIQTNYGSEQVEVAARTSLVNALSKDSMDSLYERRIEASKKAEKKQLRELKRKAAEAAGETWEESNKGIDKTPDVNPTCLFLNLTNNALSKATDDEAMKLASCVYGVKVKEDGSPAKQVQAAAKAQKYISQYFAPNLLRGKVVEFNKSYKLEGQTFKLNALKDSVFVVKPVNGDSLFEKAKAAMLADEIYDGVVFVSRRLMALVLPQDYLADLKAGKLDGKILIGRAYFTNFMVKGGFHIMSPEFMKATGRDMIAYGSKGEICPTWSDDRATIILNSGVPKARKGVCTDTQSLINGFDLRDPAVIDIFKKIEEDATTRLEEILSNLRVKNEMSELDSEIFTDLMDGDESEPEGVADALLAASRLKEVLGGTAKVIGNGIPLPQLVAPIMNQLTNQAMDPARTRLPLALKMPNANGEMVYTKIAESVYPQVHPGLMLEAVAEVMKLDVQDETKALWSAYKNAVSEEQIKSLVENHLKPLGLTYDPNRVIFCNTADYNRIMSLHGSPLAFYYRNPSTFKSGAWGILVPMDSVPVGCRWVMPTPEAFEIFFKAQDGADLDDRMAEIHGDLAKSCIRFQERKKQAIIAMTPGEEKRKVALDFLNSQVGQFRHMALDTRFDFKGWYSFGFGGDDEALVRDLVGDRAANDFVLKELNNAHLKAEERRNRKQAEGKTNAKLPPSTIPVGLTAFIMNMAKLQFAERYFTEGALDTRGNLRVFSSPLERVDSAIFALENMKGTTGTAANVQMLMGAIMQGLVHFGDKFNLRANVRSVIESDGLDPNGEWKSLTYLDLILLTMSEMLSNVIDADTQGQNVPEAVKVMQMIWSVSMYMGLALFGDPSKKVEKYEGETTVSYSMHMLPASQMKFYFPGWLMKRGIAAFAAPFAGQSQLLQEGDAATGQGIKALHFAFKNVKVERATSWVFDLFEKYKDSVLRIAFEQVEQTLEESPWVHLEAALGTHEAEIAGFADFCSRLNRSRFDKIAQVEALPLDKKSRIRARAAVEQAWLKEWHAWNESGKLRFALWTFLQLVKRANAFKTDQANPERALSCEQFIKSGRRSFGSIQVDKLPIHTLYVGNYLNEDGTPVMSADGLPEGPWVYSLKALNVLGASAPQSTVVLGFSFNDEYKDFGKAYFAFINGKGPDVAELGLDIKTPMVKRKSEFGDAFVLDSEVASQINSEVVGQLLSDVLRAGILKTKGENFLGKLRVERGATTLINTAFRDFFKDTKVVTPELLEEFISHKGLDKYRVISIETDVTGNTKASNPAVQVLHPTFKVTVAFEGEVSPLGKLDLSEFAPSVDQVDYSSGPIGYHTDVDFDNYDFDSLEDVAVEDFTYSEVIESEVVEAKPEINVKAEVVEVKTEVKAEPEVEVPTYRHPFTDPDPNLILASKYYEGDEEEEEGFSTWLASQASMAGVGDYRVFDRSAMLVIESPNSLRQLLKIHTEYCLDVKSLQTREDFIEDLRSNAEFFLYLKEKGYTGLYVEVGYFEEQEDMDEAFMEHFLHHFSEPLLFWFYGDEDGSGCHSYRYQLSLDFCSGSDPEPEPAEVEVEPEVVAEVTVYQGLHGRSDGRQFQYWTEDKEEAKTYGSQIDSRKVDLTNFLVRLSKDGSVAYDQLWSEHYRETGKPFDLLNPGENSNAFFTRVKAAGYSGISFLGNDESRYVVTFDGDGDNRTEDIDGYYRLPEKTVTLGVIGTAGRGENLTKEHFLFMVERTKKAVAAIRTATGAEAIRLVSGGAAWSDHVAVSLLMGAEVEALTLHLGAEFENNAFTVKEANDAGDAMNKYHRQFSLAMTDGESQSWSLEDIQAMVNTYWNDPRDERHQVTFQSGEIKGLFDRNTLIAEDSDFLIAFTFGEKEPAGGVKDTYDKYLALGKKNARHVSLVGVVNDTPPTPPGLPVVHNKHANTASETAVYIGRPTKWGNPFSHQAETSAKWKCQTRDEAVEKYADWVVQQPELMKSLHELKGKDLVCWCAPKKCHGDILLKLANKSTEQEPPAPKSHYGQLVISETDNFKSKDFEFMSNMYPCPVPMNLGILEYYGDSPYSEASYYEIPEEMQGVVFASSETLYQWIKCDILNREENTILPTDNGYTAKKKAKDFKPSSPEAMAVWNELKVEVMYFILESKFADQADTPEGMYLAFRLYAATSGGKVTPVENNHWGDTFWGKCKGKGENHLGQLLHKVANLPKVKLAAKKYVEKFFKE